MSTTTAAPSPREPIWPLFLVFLRLGLTSFGGPAAHLGYFRQEFVARRRWLSEQTYADLVAMCQFLPGPSSSQVGLAIGLIRGGYRGALAAWLGFTLPSAVLLMVVALSVLADARWLSGEVVHGLKIVAVAIVAQAVWGMAQTLCRGPQRLLIMALAALATGLLHGSLVQLGVIVLAGLAGRLLLHGPQMTLQEQLPLVVSRRAGRACLLLFFVLLAGIPLLASLYPAPWLQQINIFYRVGSLVFGGGHVVLPLLQAAVVAPGWVGDSAFLAGYGVAQAVPGPLFTFAAFLGAALRDAPNGWLGATLALVSIFAPSFLLVAGTTPFWERLRRSTRMQAALAGVNAAVVGLLLAALYQPVWRETIVSARDFAAALVAFIALVFWRVPPWAVVIASAALGWAATTLI